MIREVEVPSSCRASIISGHSAPLRSYGASPQAKNGGARRNRTDDLLHAMQALSQLSYDPTGLQIKAKILFGFRSGRNLVPRP